MIVCLLFLYKNKTKQNSGRVSFKEAKEKKIEKFCTDCNNS